MLKLKEIKTSLCSYINSAKITIRKLLFLNFLAFPLSFVFPKLYQILLDDVMAAQQLRKFWIVSIGLLILFVIQTLLSYLKQNYENKVNKSFNMNVRRDVWHNLLNMSFGQQEGFYVGDVKQRVVDDIDKVSNFIKDQIVDRYYNYFMVIGATALILIINPIMALICAAILPFLLFINDYIGRRSSEVNGEIRQVSDEYYGFAYDSLQFWREVKLQNAEQSFVDKFTDYRNTFAKLGMKSIKYWGYGEVFNDFKTNYLNKVLIYLLGVAFIINDKLTVGTLVMFAEYYGYCFNALNSIITKNIDIKKNNPFYSRVIDVLNMKQPVEGNADADIDGSLSIENISFSYGDNQIIKNYSFEIKSGDRVAVIGESGCGKTTLFKLMLGILEADEGNIKYSHMQLTDISKSYLYRQVSSVMQDPYFFNLSIKDNLALANPSASKYQIEKACRTACIYDYITSLPDGYDTLIGENGVKLSGGQKQRLAIARSLLIDPKIIFLDEATSALDEENEKRIMENLTEEYPSLTIILISHKPSIIALMDKKISLSKERIYNYE